MALQSCSQSSHFCTQGLVHISTRLLWWSDGAWNASRNCQCPEYALTTYLTWNIRLFDLPIRRLELLTGSRWPIRHHWKEDGQPLLQSQKRVCLCFVILDIPTGCPHPKIEDLRQERLQPSCVYPQELGSTRVGLILDGCWPVGSQVLCGMQTSARPLYVTSVHCIRRPEEILEPPPAS